VVKLLELLNYYKLNSLIQADLVRV